MSRPALTLAVVVFGLLGTLAAPAVARTGPAAVVLYSRSSPTVLPALPGGCCKRYAVEDLGTRLSHARTVIFSGHSLPPGDYGGLSPGRLARAISAFHPQLVVLDTCYGASTPILRALAATGQHPWIVAPPFLISTRGLTFGRGFLAQADPARAARLVSTDPPYPLLRWKLDWSQLARARRAASRLEGEALRRHLVRSFPPLAAVPMAGETPGGEVLVPLSPRRASAR